MRVSLCIAAAIVSVVASAMSAAMLWPIGSFGTLTGLGTQEFCFETPYPVASLEESVSEFWLW